MIIDPIGQSERYGTPTWEEVEKAAGEYRIKQEYEKLSQEYMNRKNSGRLVKTKDGKLGRTFHYKGLIKDKVPVYLATNTKKFGNIEIATEYTDKAILCDPKTLTAIGFID